MAKRPDRGTNRGGRARTRRRAPRPGRNARKKDVEALGRRPNKSARGLKSNFGTKGHEGFVLEVATPNASGQQLVVEDAEGQSWQVQCLGEPVEMGTKIAFEPVGDAHRGRGELLRILGSRREEWICRVVRTSDERIDLVPFGAIDMPSVALAVRDALDAKHNDRVRVVAKKTKKGDAPRRPVRGTRRSQQLPVRIVEILGQAGEPEADHRALVWKHRLPRDFPRRARLEAGAIPAERSPEEMRDRLDLRDRPFITIDPASARDHDDAVFAEESVAPMLQALDAAGGEPRKSRGTWKRKLWVAIADVAHFVDVGTAIDSEARRRGNSFYFPDRAIPMLPERLSTDLCSLRPEEDRLAMVVELRLLEDGRVADALFHNAIIRSHARLSYEEATAFLEASPPEGSSPEDEPESGAEANPPWADSLRCLEGVATQLEAARRKAGAITLDVAETGIVLDSDGRPVDAVERQRHRAHILIEEAMLAANRAVAKALDQAKHETLHRVNAAPRPQKLAGLQTLLEHLGIESPEDLSESGALASVLDQVKGSPSEHRIHIAVLRSLSQARYEAVSRGHHALQFDHYLHFTSPIRRYADLDVHRALKRLIKGAGPAGSENNSSSPSPEALAIWLSGRERVAVDVERDAIAVASCALLEGRQGERFPAKVQAVSEFGLFIRLTGPVIDGLLPVRTLPGEWRVDAETERLVGPRSGMQYSLGDEIEVEIHELDFDRARIAFSIAGKRPKTTLRRPAGGNAKRAARGRLASKPRRDAKRR